jgi:pyruvate/2-oxoacid:ferredoxin oxidoreductase beta subunit/Pyruvate/2-oxoacid:ferredoxin oxidoreductase gamma subunit
MSLNILTDKKFPFCPGCGHGVVVKSISKALMGMEYSPLDVIIVSDIGCSGLVDPLFATHTIHGLHGRAPALGLGVSMGLSNPDKKVIVIQGDGGVTIGLQHVLEAARRNSNITLVVLNNLLYGMTGGQMSGLSTNEFKSSKHVPDEAPPFDIIKLAHQAGSALSIRVTNPKEFPEKLREAFSTPGFSIVEASSMCTSYAYKKLSDFANVIEAPVVFKNDRIAGYHQFKETLSLFKEEEVLPHLFESKIKERVGVVIAGSAGGGVQSAAKLLANAGILSGLYATMKGEYPITVGTGFSAAEVILSREPIYYTGLEKPEVVIMVTSDGKVKVRDRITGDTWLIADESLAEDDFKRVEYKKFQKSSGKKGAALRAVFHWVESKGLLEKEALEEAVTRHKYADSLLEIMHKTL